MLTDELQPCGRKMDGRIYTTWVASLAVGTVGLESKCSRGEVSDNKVLWTNM